MDLFPFYVVEGGELCSLAGLWHGQPRWRSLATGRLRWSGSALPARIKVGSEPAVTPAWSGLHPAFPDDDKKIKPTTPLSRLTALVDEAPSGYLFLVGDSGLGRSYLLSFLEQSGPLLLKVGLRVHDVPDGRLWLARVDEALRQRASLRGVLPPAELLRAELAALEKPTARFTAWLNALLALNGPLVLALELADVPEGEGVGTGLAEFLPDELPAGAIVLISCFPERQPVADATRLEALRHAGARCLELEKNSTANLDVLNDWIQQHSLHEDLPASELMKKAEYRILWLRLFNRAFAANLFDSNRQLLNAVDFYQAVLRQLADRLGKRAFETRLLPLLLALAQTSDGMPLEVVWQWDGYRPDTPDLVARAGLLLRRGSRGRIQLLHASLRRYLVQQYEAQLPGVARLLVEQVRVLPPEPWLFEHMWGWALESQDMDVLAGLLEQETALFEWVHQLGTNGYPATAVAAMQDAWVGIRKLKDDDAKSDAEPRVARLQCLRGELYASIGERAVALQEYTLAIGCLVTRAEEAPDLALPLAEALSQRAELLAELGKEADALEDCEAADRWLGTVPESARNAAWWRCRARSAGHWGTLLEGSKTVDAVARLRASLEAWGKLPEKGSSPLVLAESWLHVADLHGTLEESLQALTAYGEAIDLLKTIQPMIPQVRALLARALSGRCQARTDLALGGQNTEDLVSLVDVLEHMVHVDGMTDRVLDLALAHHAVGSLLGSGRSSFRCLVHEREAVRLLDHMAPAEERERGRLLRSQALAISARTARRLGETSWALEDATSAVEGFHEALERDQQAHVREGLVRVLAIRRDAFCDLGEWPRAHQDADRVIALCYQGGDEFGALLAEAFVARAGIWRHQRRFAHGLMDLERALELGPIETVRARALRERGLTRAVVGDAEAAEDFDSAIAVAGDDEDLLVERALAYADRAALGLATGELRAVGANLDEASRLWEELVPHPREHPDSRRVLGLARTLLHQAQWAWLSRDPHGALEKARLAIDLYRRPSSQESQTAAWSELAYALDMVAQIWFAEGRRAQALEAWAEATNQYEQLWVQQPGNPDVAQALGDVLCHRSAAVLLQAGREAALDDLARSLSLYGRAADALAGPAEEARLRLRQSLAHLGRARLLLESGNLAAAQGEASRSLQLAAALRQGPSLPGLHLHLAGCHRLRAELHQRRAELELAQEEFGRAVDVLERLVRFDGLHPGDLALVLLQRAGVRLEQGEPELALRDCETAGRVVAQGTPWMAQVLDQTARLRFSQGEHDSALAQMLQAVQLYEESLGDGPDSDLRMRLARACCWLADHEKGELRTDESAAWWDEAVETLREAPSEHPHRLAEVWLELASQARRRQEHDNAEQALTTAVQILEHAERRDLQAELAQALEHRLRLRQELGRWQAALGDLERLQGLVSDGPLARARLAATKALLLHRLGQPEDMREACQTALVAYDRALKAVQGGPPPPEVVHERARVHNNWAVALLEQGEGEAAQRELSRAIEIRTQLVKQKAPGHIHVDLAVSYYNRGVAAHVQGKREQALQDFQNAAHALEVLSGQGVEVREKLALTLSNLGQVLSDLGRGPEALTRFNAAVTVFKQLSADPKAPIDTEGQAVCIYNRGVLRHREGKKDEARQDFDTASRIFSRLIDHHGRSDLQNDLRACRLALHAAG
ncbi:MAG TPA: hypothetical protein VGO93_28045 [Candidatus Xenobia bacterium]